MSFPYNSEETVQQASGESKEECESKLETELKSLQVNEDIQEAQSSPTEEDDTNEFLLPSDIDWKDYLQYPLTAVNDEEIENGGKWLLFALGDLDKLDHRWVVLQKLCNDGTLVRIKSSTAFDTEKGVTMCYTSSFENKAEVKRAADEIRKLINYEYLMFYKTNEASKLGNYQDAGKHSITNYMHTYRGGFYERGKYKRWTVAQI